MPLTICFAFTKNATPCTAIGHIDGLCGRHAHMVSTPERRISFNRAQARLRATWVGRQGVVPVPAVLPEPAPVAAVPAPPPAPVAAPAPAACGHRMANGNPCTRAPRFPDGKCTMHHNLAIQHMQIAVVNRGTTEMRIMWARGATERELDTFVEEYIRGAGEVPGIDLRARLVSQANRLILHEYFGAVRRFVANGATRDVITTLVQGWIALDGLSLPRGAQVQAYGEDLLQDLANRRQIQANQREAQLAADTQNVHTTEISKQMTDSLAILCAVEVPTDQKATMNELRESWRSQGRPEAEISIVWKDVTLWWNKATVYNIDDRLYRKAIRGLWWTIKSYKGEVRQELEKRMWDECRDACIPYSVCTQGHLARLSNVMVGFDDAFAQPVAVGEILQQKMGAISEMEVDDEKKIELAKALLAELKVPEEKHADWLAAF